MLNDSQLAELRRNVELVERCMTNKMVEIDVRILRALLDELEKHRLVNLQFERRKAEPAFRD